MKQPKVEENKQSDKPRCKKCGRTDLIIVSNGLCKRCDEHLYGKALGDHRDWSKTKLRC